MLAPAQVHAQQHLGPVLRLGTAGPGLDVDEGVGRIHLAGEHALELQPVDAAGEALDILDHGAGRVLVVLGLGQVQQLAGDRKSVVSGKSVSERVDLGGRRNIKKKNKKQKNKN